MSTKSLTSNEEKALNLTRSALPSASEKKRGGSSETNEGRRKRNSSESSKVSYNCAGWRMRSLSISMSRNDEGEGAWAIFRKGS